MRVVADLHVHSRFSRATSRNLDLAALHSAAAEKGVQLIGTGDFTHPAWLHEIEEGLEPAEDGLFRLRPSLLRRAMEDLPVSCRNATVRFVLQVEICNIYKRDGRVRKNHNLVFAPTLDVARALSQRLSVIGNVAADGRPILGLDARDLLEIALDIHPDAFLIPAHIWTPWFSLLGSKSGFDSLEACFGDLSDHVFAAETGLSSDPAMNWRVRSLDRLTLVSNSDAHSASKVGREANLFDIDLSYKSLLHALRTRRGFLGTIEFFPEEGKYHLDGHRKCGVCLKPSETRELAGMCPVCGGALTVGVMSRVLELADRPACETPPNISPFERLLPLEEVAAESLGVGVASKQVRQLVDALVGALGPELAVLREVPLEDVTKVAGSRVADGIGRVRSQEVTVESGYDGKYGRVRLFE